MVIVAAIDLENMNTKNVFVVPKYKFPSYRYFVGGVICAARRSGSFYSGICHFIRVERAGTGGGNAFGAT